MGDGPMTCHVCGRHLVMVQYTSWFWAEMCPARFDGLHPDQSRVVTTSDTTAVQLLKDYGHG